MVNLVAGCWSRYSLYLPEDRADSYRGHGARPSTRWTVVYFSGAWPFKKLAQRPAVVPIPSGPHRTLGTGSNPGIGERSHL